MTAPDTVDRQPAGAHTFDIRSGRRASVPETPDFPNEETGASGQQVRTFDTGAIRDLDDGKYDYEGSLSPLVLRRYAAYMHAHTLLPNGERRTADNWQKGFPLDVLMKSAWRHFMDWWTLHRGHPADRPEGGAPGLEDALCGLIFNASAYLHELLENK